jgi:hypothetical protein
MEAMTTMRTLAAKVLDSTHLELSEPILSRPGQHIEVSIARGWAEARQGAAAVPSGVATTAPASAPGLSPPRRARELAWRRTHDKELDAYTGQWIVLEGEEVMSHGHHPAKVLEQARERGVEVPYIFFVEDVKPNVFKMGL